jgi:sortase A
VVEPNDLKDLEMVEGKDYCTLVTCTPYGINSHRMLVRGKRVKNPKEEVVILADAVQVRNYFVAIVLGIVLLILYVIIISIPVKKRKNL